ncbi:MAG: hypothetical protein K2L18_02640 [Acetatifactor sp.]|nr:hypothetical protein [Acetatifactor sp.]
MEVFCNSQSTRLVRAADIVANRIYYLANHDGIATLGKIAKLNMDYMPEV